MLELLLNLKDATIRVDIKYRINVSRSLYFERFLQY